MSELEAILLADARAALERQVLQLGGRNDLLEAFAAWVSPATALSVSTTAAEASRRTGAQRTYSDVAVLGYAADLGALDQPGLAALKSGLEWVSGRPASIDGAPTGLGTDGVAALGIALGARVVDTLLLGRVRDWLGAVADAARGSGIAPWHRFLFVAASVAAGVVPRPETPVDSHLADLRILLSAHGLFEYATPEAEEADSVLVIGAAKTMQLSEMSSGEAAIRLAALVWITRTAPIAVPGRATIPQVADLLRRVPMALRLWTWEEKARTRNGTARKWHIDHEYHVQNLLWTILAPIFPDLKAEESTPSVGQKHPRADLCLPSLRLIVEVKFIRDAVPFADVVEEVAADAALYFGKGSPYDSFIVFLWDDSRRVEEHEVFIRGVRQIPRVSDVIVASRPGSMV